jgi:hypothetical protein
MGLHGATVFFSAFLLFQIQPVIGRVILPWFGGTPAVWTTCMLFFQVLLLAGYAYSHGIISRLSHRAQGTVHLAVLGAALLTLVAMLVSWGIPLIPDSSFKPPDGSAPTFRVLKLLAVSVGLPFFVLSTTGPLVQAWWARVQSGASAYRLYSLSNAGSLLALLGYPFLVEPAFALRTQAAIWSVGFVVFVVLCGLSAIQVRSVGGALETASESAPDPGPSPSVATRAMWVLLAFCPSVMLLATTNQMCQDLSPVPFLWVLPLALYLLTFILCFESDRWYRRGSFAFFLCILGVVVCAVLNNRTETNMPVQVATFSATLFVCCMTCHGELVRLKPSARFLTTFYLMVSVGGALGGLFTGLLAPILFTGFWEYQLGLGACFVLMATVLFHDPSSPLHGPRRKVARTAVLAGLASIVLGLFSTVALYETQWAARSFYGVLRVSRFNENDPKEHAAALYNGMIMHGFQHLGPGLRRVPTAYYGPLGGGGLALRRHPRRLSPNEADRALRVGVLGLGVGTQASYGQAGDEFRFYEINPEVDRLAGLNGTAFSFLKDSPAKTTVVMGDGRLSLERELATTGSNGFDVFVLDVFAGDSIPVHLLTREALALYVSHLRQPDGVIAAHISNRYLDLRPLVIGLAKEKGLTAVSVTDDGDGDKTLPSQYMLITASRAFLEDPEVAKAVDPDAPVDSVRLWTDDFSSLIGMFK